MASTLMLVCKTWSGLASVILYETVRVGPRFRTLSKCLRYKDYGRHVRMACLGPYETKDNQTLIRQCPLLEVIVKPRSGMISWWAFDPSTESYRLPNLTHLHWCEEGHPGSFDLFLNILNAAPNLQVLSLFHEFGQRRTLQHQDIIPSPTRPKLQTLQMITDHSPIFGVILQHCNLRNLTTLVTAPSIFLRNESPLPILYQLRHLELFGSRSRINFTMILSVFPDLKELCFSA